MQEINFFMMLIFSHIKKIISNIDSAYKGTTFISK